VHAFQPVATLYERMTEARDPSRSTRLEEALRQIVGSTVRVPRRCCVTASRLPWAKDAARMREIEQHFDAYSFETNSPLRERAHQFVDVIGPRVFQHQLHDGVAERGFCERCGSMRISTTFAGLSATRRVSSASGPGAVGHSQVRRTRRRPSRGRVRMILGWNEVHVGCAAGR